MEKYLEEVSPHNASSMKVVADIITNKYLHISKDVQHAMNLLLED
jgi:hypothetical protein